jgi:hypothetical protein
VSCDDVALVVECAVAPILGAAHGSHERSLILDEAGR